MSFLRTIGEGLRQMRDEPAGAGYCPGCGRWVHLDPVWGCRHCRSWRSGPWTPRR